MENLHKYRNGFTLVELLIVVAILGILGAIALPMFQENSEKARESAAKENIRLLRTAIERYAADHGGVAPGYINDDSTRSPNYMAFARALTDIEHYLSDIPKNPFNDLRTTDVLDNAEAFPVGPTMTSTYGWIYKPATKQIRLNWSGTDSQGKTYFDY